MIIRFLFILFLLLPLAGCDQLMNWYRRSTSKFADVENSPQAAQTSVEKLDVQDIDLAKILVKPERHELQINRDPFKPLLETDTPNVQAKEDPLANMQFVGVVKVGDTFSALIKTEKGKNVYSVNDKLGELVIINITEEFVEFKKGEEVHQLKRGPK